MSRQCELTGVKPLAGNNVSHSHRKTKRRFLPNLLWTRIHSSALKRQFKLRISASALRNIDKQGGLDAFLMKADDAQLSASALKIKRELGKLKTPATAPEDRA